MNFRFVALFIAIYQIKMMIAVTIAKKHVIILWNQFIL